MKSTQGNSQANIKMKPNTSTQARDFIDAFNIRNYF